LILANYTLKNLVIIERENLKRFAIFVQLRLVTDGRTDGRKHDDSIYHASIAHTVKTQA